MERYEIRCTEEQTKIALELGAPINLDYHKDDFENSIKIRNLCYAEVPTAEQMIGWLEDKSLQVTIHFRGNSWYYNIMSNYKVLSIGKDVSSRKEATLTAIEFALEYLSKISNENNGMD